MSGRLAGILLLALLAGCSSFPGEFKRASARPRGGDPIEGAWQGTWKSDSGHSGRLRCVLTSMPATAKDAVPGTMPSAASVRYRASFEARFWGIFTAHYT